MITGAKSNSTMYYYMICVALVFGEYAFRYEIIVVCEKSIFDFALIATG